MSEKKSLSLENFRNRNLLERFCIDLSNPDLPSNQRVSKQSSLLELVGTKANNSDLIAGAVYIRQQEKKPSEKDIVAAVGITESQIPGIKATPHTLYFKPPDIENWQSLSQEERQNKLKAEVLPNIKRFIITFHGWGGNRNVFEIPASLLFNPDKINLPEGLPNKQNLEKIKNELPDNTMIISLSIMGAENTLDPKKAGGFTPWSAVAQVYEALEHIGQQINVDQFYNKIAAVIGHSMGGWIAFQMFLLNYFSESQENFSLSLYYNYAKEIKNLFPNAIFLPITPVIIGTNLSKALFPEIINHVRLLSSILGIPIQLTNWLEQNKYSDTRKKIVELANFFRILPLILKLFINAKPLGQKEIVASHQKEFKDGRYILQCSNNLNRMPEIIESTTLPFITQNRQTLDRLLKKLRIFIGEKDKVLNPKQMQKMILNILQSIDNKYQDISPLADKIPDSGHYLSTLGWEKLIIKLLVHLDTLTQQ